MNRRQYARLFVVAVAACCLVLTAAFAQSGKAGKKEYAFRGKVEKVDANAKTIAVNNEAIPGWMNSMTMTYTVDKPDVLKSIKTGDQITAKVYEGDFKTLYEVKVAPPSGEKNQPKK